MASLGIDILGPDGKPGPESSVAGNGRRGPRIALYSHDTQGLGHIRRNLLISGALCDGGATPTILLLSGLREASAFALPPGVDCLTLPSLGKGVDGLYFPRSLDVPMADLIAVRSKAMTAVLRSFDPDLLIVDKVPRGVFDELTPSLDMLTARGRARIVLGLREVLDEPDAVRREWDDGDYEGAIRRHYHHLWIYGDREVYDTVNEYDLPADIAAMASYTGYLNPLDLPQPLNDDLPEYMRDLPAGDGPLTACLVGGGRDGMPLAEAFLTARMPGPRVLVTGPLMPEESQVRLRGLAASCPSLRILEFVTDPCPLLARADRVIAMGGYNTVCEIMAYEKPALIVPRTQPRVEQLIRATRLAALGLIDVLRPESLTSGALSSWAATAAAPPPAARAVIDFNGMQRLPQLMRELLAANPLAQETVHVAS